MDLSNLSFWDIAVVVVWVLFAVFSHKKNRRQTEETREYPQFPDENEQPYDPEEEDRKLKAWLEDMFDQHESHPPKNPGHGERIESHYKKDHSVKINYERKGESPQPPASLPGTPLRTEVAPRGNIPVIAAQETPRVKAPAARPVWLKNVDKQSLAYGFVIAEVLARPRALRAARRGGRDIR